MTKPNIFIRGIYSTALTSLFLDAGYPIIFPSTEIQNRFKIPFRPGNSFSKDISIRDRLDRQGVSIMFKKAIWDQLEANDFQDFPLSQGANPNFIIYKALFHKNSIYRGLIVKSHRDHNYSFIRLIPEGVNNQGKQEEDHFHTTIGRYSRFIPDSKEGIFQITHEDSGQIRASLGSHYTIPGDLLVLVPNNNRVIISKEIINGKQKKRLFDLGKEMQSTRKYGFGIIFRTAAELAMATELKEEADRLEEDLIQTQNIITQFPERIGEIYSNYRSLNVIFPVQVKKEFDAVRGEIIPTIENHHMIKSSHNPRWTLSERNRRDKKVEGPKKYTRGASSHRSEVEKSWVVGDLVNFTEKLLKSVSKESQTVISNNFMSQYYRDFLQPRHSINIIHQKLTGKTLNLSSGFIRSIDWDRITDIPSRITIKRRMREGGLYDGLNTPIEAGDYAIGEFQQGNWYYVSSYYGRDAELKGRYFNINTPLEITYKGGIHYIDLEIDVIENMVGKRKIIDLDLLDTSLAFGIISDELYSKALTIAENIVEGKIG